MTFQDIFSKSKPKTEQKIPNPKIQIIIDTREKQSLIATNLFSKKANIDFQKLEVGDYEIGEFLIERKTFPDFISSMINKRLQEQLINLKKSKRPLLLVEGNYTNQSNSKIHPNAIKGMILSIQLDFQVPIINTKDENDTVDFLILLAKRQEKEKQEFSIRPSRNLKNLEEQKLFILEGFPGIGPTLSKSLLEKFKTLKNIFNAKEEDLQNIPKFDEKKLDNFKRILEN